MVGDGADILSVCVLGVNSLCQSLCANPSIPSSLVHLDLSGNVLRGDDMQVHISGGSDPLRCLSQ